MGVEQSNEADGGFFIPDLSGSKAVFRLVLVAELFVFILVLALPSHRGFDWSYLALVSLFVQWVVLVCTALISRLRRLLGQLSLAFAVVVTQTLILLVTLFCSLGGLWLMDPWSGQYWWTVDYWFLARNLMIAALVSGMLLRYFFLLQELQLRQRSELEARLNVLQARMRPHFLFNTLNSILGLVHRQPLQAEEAILDLSDLLRASLDDSAQLILLGDELRLCRGYLRIEQLRLGERLQIEWDLGLPEETPVPPFCIQPLLENAIVHGIAQCPAGGRLSISSGRDGMQCWLRVSNPMPVQPELSKGNKMATSNIQARLQALFGSRARLQLIEKGGLHSAELSWPLVEPD